MSQFFIDRPVFAWVIAIVIMLIGGLSIFTLPIERYPDIAPPAVNIVSTYPGANAETLETSVTQIIEQQLVGVDNLLYFASSSTSAGQMTITATFRNGTNPDVAQMQVQNKIQQALPLLPQEVQRLGVTVTKSRDSFLMIVGLYDKSGRYDNVDISDFLASNLQDSLARVPGVGNIQVFGSQYAMRIWLNPYKLQAFGLTPADVRNAVQAQNAQVAAGALGSQPVVEGQQLNITVTAQSRLRTAAQFDEIILRTQTDGSVVKLKDVARAEIGSAMYGIQSRYKGMPASGIAIQLSPGANALATANAVRAEAESLRGSFPPGMDLVYPVDTTTFVRISINAVVQTLIEAIVLVVLVMYLFLQNWRATLIPAIAVPVVLLGTFGVLAAFGYSINTLTMFGLVLAIGLLVDDAIVVVENVERIMREEKLGPLEATRKSMQEITGALIGIGLVLSAVFVPMAFFGGSTGVIYRQFSITIVSAMALSVVVALILTPTLCATLLKPLPAEGHAKQGRFFTWFNRNFDAGVEKYKRSLLRIFDKPILPLVGYVAIIGALILLFVRLPGGFLPEEDQGFVITQFTLPAGAIQSRALEVAKQVEHHYLVDEKENVEDLFLVVGFSFAGAGQNTGVGFVRLKDWSERSGASRHANAIVGRAMGAYSKIRDAQAFALIPPSVPGLGISAGFTFQLQDRGGLGHEGLQNARNQLLGLAAQNPLLMAVRPNSLEDTPQLHIDIDTAKASALGLSLANINDTLSTAWAGSFISDFVDRGRVKRVYLQGDAPYRMLPEDLYAWHERNNTTGEMAPFSSFTKLAWARGPSALQRFNGVSSIEIQGAAAPGISSGTAIQEMQKIASQLPKGTGYEWSGASYQEIEAGSQAPALYALSILVIFLCLAALYESWSVPFSVLLVIPLGVIGALLAATMRGLYNDVFFQVGLLTTMGLSAKNAILIVEFAEFAVRRGVPAREAAIEAARQRLRPILMTSFAFIAGVTPLAISTGAGAGGQNAIGTGVIGGMLSATILTIFLVPLFFVLVQKAVEWRYGKPV